MKKVINNEYLDLSKLPVGIYKLPTTTGLPSHHQGYEINANWLHPIELYGLQCIKDDDSGNVWARNPKTWKWELLVRGTNHG